MRLGLVLLHLETLRTHIIVFVCILRVDVAADLILAELTLLALHTIAAHISEAIEHRGKYNTHNSNKYKDYNEGNHRA